MHATTTLIMWCTTAMTRNPLIVARPSTSGISTQHKKGLFEDRRLITCVVVNCTHTHCVIVCYTYPMGRECKDTLRATSKYDLKLMDTDWLHDWWPHNTLTIASWLLTHFVKVFFWVCSIFPTGNRRYVLTRCHRNSAGHPYNSTCSIWDSTFTNLATTSGCHSTLSYRWLAHRPMGPVHYSV